MTDDIRATLTEIRRRAGSVCLTKPLGNSTFAGLAAEDAKRLLVTKDVPALIAAVRSALAYHEPVKVYESAFDWEGKPRCGHDPDMDGWDDTHMETTDDGWVCRSKPVGTVCSTCIEDDEPAPWPCPEYAAIGAALSGSGETPSIAGTTVEEAMADD